VCVCVCVCVCVYVYIYIYIYYELQFYTIEYCNIFVNFWDPNIYIMHF